ncbi:rab15 effector protein [Latimeria chalumnae]|uniref:RAB15 effector protein n=1 Tax=Latimeria chalumnae TaxID=7897 RepID=H2ZS41_LATCH|nr:PREDICTED: rab15 effector protein [Latimeria chalumnae]|eukprot:XP_006014595.1 PREDICTED: rab15 effector protein [Latimeria chalumnae]
MGQSVSQEAAVEDSKPDVICEVFAQAVVHTSLRLKEYLGFEDPQSKLRPSTDTLNEIFLMNFITFCMEKGVEELVATNKMTKQQSLLFGVDWIWTLFGPERNMRLQLAVQTLQMANESPEEGDHAELMCTKSKESALADQLYRNKSRFEKLLEFCSLVGPDCVGLFIVFGVPGKPREIRGILLDAVRKEKNLKIAAGEDVLRMFILNTETFVSTREMLENCLSKKNGLKSMGQAYVNFL